VAPRLSCPGPHAAPEHLVNFGLRRPFVRDTDAGCQMRSRPTCPRLHQLCTEEMGRLAELLPIIYRQVAGDTAF